MASSSRGMSTALEGRWTYLTTEPLMNTFFTELYFIVSTSHPEQLTLSSTRVSPPPRTSPS